MSPPGELGARPERSDTKTLVGLGREDVTRPSSDRPAAGDRRLVQLWFKGLAEPVRAHAEIGAGGLQLQADLPFLELDSAVAVDLGDGTDRLDGYVRTVAFAQSGDRRVPQLRVDVALLDASTIGRRPPARARRAAAIAAMPAARTPLGVRVLGWLLALLVGAACGAGAVLGWLTPGPASRQGARASAPLKAAVRPQVRARVQVESGAAKQPAAPVITPAVAAAVQPEPPMAPVSLDRYDVLAPRSPGDEQAALAAIESARDAAVARAQAAAAATQRPQVTVQGGQTHVFIPMEGAGEGLRQYELTTPGVAVTVPKARALIPLGNYSVQRGIVRRVWLRRAGPGAQVRILTRRTPTRAAASYDETGLNVVLAP